MSSSSISIRNYAIKHNYPWVYLHFNGKRPLLKVGKTTFGPKWNELLHQDLSKYQQEKSEYIAVCLPYVTIDDDTHKHLPKLSPKIQKELGKKKQTPTECMISVLSPDYLGIDEDNEDQILFEDAFQYEKFPWITSRGGIGKHFIFQNDSQQLTKQIGFCDVLSQTTWCWYKPDELIHNPELIGKVFINLKKFVENMKQVKDEVCEETHTYDKEIQKLNNYPEIDLDSKPTRKVVRELVKALPKSWIDGTEWWKLRNFLKITGTLLLAKAILSFLVVFIAGLRKRILMNFTEFRQNTIIKQSSLLFLKHHLVNTN